MSQNHEYTPMFLLPSQRTGTSLPFVAPTFEMAFRNCEKLFWDGFALLEEESKRKWDPRREDKDQAAIDSFERRLRLRFMFAEMLHAGPALERELQNMVRPMDPRYGKCSDADCLDGWLLDAAKLNVIKARGMLQTLGGLMKDIEIMLTETAESTCAARAVLNRKFNLAASGD